MTRVQQNPPLAEKGGGPADEFDEHPMSRDNELNTAAGSIRSRGSGPAACPLDFEAREFPRVLLDLYQQNFSGTLVARQNTQERHFLFLRGAPYAFQPSQEHENLSAWLVARGVLSPAEQSRSAVDTPLETNTESESGCNPQLPARMIFTQARAHLRQYLLISLGWTHGTWETHATPDVGSDAEPLRIDPLEVVQSAVQRHWSLEKIIENLAPRLHDVPRFATCPEPILRRLGSDASVRAFVEGVNGQRPLGETLVQGAESSLGLATAWLLTSVGVIAFDGETMDPPRAPESRASESKTNPNLREQVKGRLHNSETGDAYQTLAISRGASAKEIRAAYRSAAKQFHPDTLSRLNLEDDLREQAALLFSRITRAWRELRKTRNHPPNRGEEKRADGEALVRAETLFRKAEVLLRKGNFEGALEFLQPAVEIQPADAAYQSALGWARFRHEASDADAALEHLQIAKSLDPKLAGLGEKMRRVEAHLEGRQAPGAA